MADQSGIERLLHVMARLRDPETGCPWDLEQDFRSIAPFTIEEAYEKTPLKSSEKDNIGNAPL